MIPLCSISSKNLWHVFCANSSVEPTSKHESNVMIPPVVVSAFKDNEYPGEIDPLSPLKKSV